MWGPRLTHTRAEDYRGYAGIFKLSKRSIGVLLAWPVFSLESFLQRLLSNQVTKKVTNRLVSFLFFWWKYAWNRLTCEARLSDLFLQTSITTPTRMKTEVFFELSPAKSVLQLPLATAVDKFSRLRRSLTCRW